MVYSGTVAVGMGGVGVGIHDWDLGGCAEGSEGHGAGVGGRGKGVVRWVGYEGVGGRVCGWWGRGSREGHAAVVGAAGGSHGAACAGD